MVPLPVANRLRVVPSLGVARDWLLAPLLVAEWSFVPHVFPGLCFLPVIPGFSVLLCLPASGFPSLCTVCSFRLRSPSVRGG